jgi:hypothetical protein
MSIAEISRLSLGHCKAEAELQELEDYFITTPAYIHAKTPARRKTYYIGQRGAGKTALFKKLAEDYGKSGNSVILNITPDAFSYEKFNDAKHDYSDMRAVYGTVWHYTLITHMFKAVVDFYEGRANIKSNRQNIETLKRYLDSRDALSDYGFLGTFLGFFGDFTSSSAFSVLRVGSAGRRNYKEFLRLTSLAEISEELSAFRAITSSYPIRVFIDELDRGWDNSKEATNFIHGLFYAVGEVKKLSNVDLFVSLRSDMYNDLSSILPDPEKMREEIERFSWNPKILQWVIAKRIIANYPMNESTPYSQALSTVFDDGVLDYVIERTLQRPREVIEFCTDALTEFSNRVSYDQTLDKLNMEIIQFVEPGFSRARFEDISLEYEHQYPNLRLFLSCFESAPTYYTMQEFKAKVEDAMLRSVEKLGDQSWLAAEFSSSKLVEILFEIGFIKLYSLKDKKYLAFYEGAFLNLENVPKVRIHHVFASALKCH